MHIHVNITRCNMLITRFNKCSVKVNYVLFRTSCLCVYNIGLWKHYNITFINGLDLGLHITREERIHWLLMNGVDSMTNSLLLFKLPSFATVMHIAQRCYVSSYLTHKCT